MSVVTGGCLCGVLRYEYAGEVGLAGYCHCSDCRHITGSAFNVSVKMQSAAFRVVKGEAKGFTKHGESGNELTRHFCPECGSPLYTSPPMHPEFVFVKAGSLDDPALVKPASESWTVSRVPWAGIPAALQAYPKSR